MPPIQRIAAIVLATTLLTSGCDEDSVEIAREAADRQAAQNEQMAQLQREVAQGANQLVTADSQSRRDLLAAHQRLQVDQTQLAQGFESLEVERRRFEQSRQGRATLSTVFQGGGLLLATLLALAVAYLALRSDSSDVQDAEAFSELLASELFDTSQAAALERLAVASDMLSLPPQPPEDP